MNQSQKKHGAIPDKLDFRDYRYEFVAGAKPIPERFSLKDKIIKVKSQDGSASCVGQAFSYYAEVLNTFETEEKTKLSARDIYSLIHLETGGAYLREAAKKLVDSGIALEKDVSSYMNGKPPTEVFMRQRNDITEEELETAKNYLAKSYLKVEPKFNSLKRAIYENHGCVVGMAGNNKGWKDKTYIVPPYEGVDWGHAIYLCGYDETSIHFVNSWGTDWGDKGFGRFGKEYEGYIFSPWTIKDLPNEYYQNVIKNKALIKKLIALYKALIEFMNRTNIS